eukprot:SAG25_NODE_1616_length_2665_cov_3.756430_1_plen_281_part_00
MVGDRVLVAPEEAPKGVHVFQADSHEKLRALPANTYYVWKKNQAICFLLAKKQPLRITEEVLVFYQKQPTYNPQMVGDELHGYRGMKNTANSQGYYGELKGGKGAGHRERYLNTLLEFKISKGTGAGTRGTDIVDFFIKTYTNPGDAVLDISCYNAITGERCLALGRRYTGIDLNPTEGAKQLGGDYEVEPVADVEPLPRVPSDATTMGTSMEPFEVKVLELFARTGWVGKFVDSLPNTRSWSVDINAETAWHRPTKVIDVLLLKFLPRSTCRAGGILDS